MKNCIAHSKKFVVYVPDVDFGGVLYHANYLKIADCTRSEFLNINGYTQKKLAQSKNYFVVSRCEVSYKKPAMIEDELRCDIFFNNVRGASFRTIHHIFNNQTGSLLCIADVDIVFVSKNSDDKIKPQIMPIELHTLFTNQEKRDPDPTKQTTHQLLLTQ